MLASLHFNKNVQRETQIGENGAQYLKVRYSKYKLGEEVVRDVKTPPTYGIFHFSGLEWHLNMVGDKIGNVR